MKDKRGSTLICGGLLLLAAALCLTAYNAWDARRAEEEAHSAAAQLQEAMATAPPGPVEEESDSSQELELPVLPIDGNDYIGLLEIPALELSLPVMADWSESNLKTAPCRYLGSASEGNLIIAGHNYRSHFAGLSRLQKGDEVRFQDVQGNVFCYTVFRLETIPGTGLEEMETGEWDLTLFTCTLGGKSRVTVRCERS